MTAGVIKNFTCKIAKVILGLQGVAASLALTNIKGVGYRLNFARVFIQGTNKLLAYKLASRHILPFDCCRTQIILKDSR